MREQIFRRVVSLLFGMVIAAATTADAQSLQGPSECYLCEYNCQYWDNNCNGGEGCYVDGHKLYNLASHGNSWKNPHSMCVGGLTCAGHPTCGALASLERDEVQRLNDLLLATHHGDTNAATMLLDEYSEIVHLDFQRSALRILSGCERDLVLASVALTPKQVRQLRSLSEREPAPFAS